MNFKDSGKIKQVWILTTPLIVPTTDDPDKETSDQLMSRQEKFLKLSQEIKKKLASVIISQKIQAIGQKYGFELLRLANITRLIREYYFGEVQFENFPSEIEKRMGVSLLTAQEISRYIKSEIIDWDPWGEYIAGLPKLPIREIVQQYPKIANTEITDGYIELKNSDDLEDPTIKNWIQDYISHLGYESHSQMERAQYLFHSENGKSLNSLDREKLGIILKSFDEKIPLPVDEENGEIVFDGIENKVGDGYIRPAPAANTEAAYTRPLRNEQPAPAKQESFIKPYAPISAPQRPTLPHRQASSPSIQASTQSISHPQPIKDIPNNFASQMGKEEINKYFSAPESLEIPEVRIHSITEHNESKVAPPQINPRSNVQHPALPQPQPNMQRPIPQQPTSPRPQHRIIDPFFSKPMSEPRINGNVVDLSEK
jgi:hypothetical protein